MSGSEQLNDWLAPLVASVNGSVQGFAEEMGTVFGDAAIRLAQKMEEEFDRQLRERDVWIGELGRRVEAARAALTDGNAATALAVLQEDES